MNECSSCLGSGKSIMVGSNTPYQEFECSKCNGTGQDPNGSDDLISILQLNDFEKTIMPDFWWSCSKDIVHLMPTTDEIIDDFQARQFMENVIKN